MHTTRIYILRLLVDTDSPEAMRGTLQAVGEEAERQSFRSEADLRALLKRLVDEQVAAGAFTKKERGNDE